MPMIHVNSVDDARAFYVDKLGFDHMMGVVGSDGNLDFCTVMLDGAKIMFTRGANVVSGPPTSELYVETGDVDAYYDRVSSAGVGATQPENMWWDDRVFIATDLNGLKLWFYETVGPPVPPDGAKIV